MKFNPKFKMNNPTTKEEKLIVEYEGMLHDLTKSFINLNISKFTNNEIFITIRDGALGFAGRTIHALKECIDNENQTIEFLKESQDIFNCYIQQAWEDKK